jgi:hypothetical protein
VYPSEVEGWRLGIDIEAEKRELGRERKSRQGCRRRVIKREKCGERGRKEKRRTICPFVDGVAEVPGQACVCVPPPDPEGVVKVDHEDVGDAAGTPGVASDPSSTVLVLPRALRNPIILEPPESILIYSR